MRKLLVLGAVSIALASPTASRAQFSLGARVGYALAMGDAEKDVTLSDFVKSQVPIQVDAMYNVVPDFAIGAYFSYGFAQVDFDGACDESGVDCSGSSIRLGAQAAYTFSKVSPTFVPWLGVGLGYEWATMKAEIGPYEAELKSDGFEFLNLQAGGDFRVNEKFSVGPYIQLSIAQYANYDSDVPMFDPFTGDYLGNVKESGSIQDKAIHEWLGFGVRGKFDL